MEKELAPEITPALLASKFINTTNRNIFLTGKAGTGKTTFLRSIIKNTFKRAVIVAPTGIAAINAGGVTIHSLFQLPFGAFAPESQSLANVQMKINDSSSLMKNLMMAESKRKLLRELELLIIDEVSMLRADLLDAIDTVLKHIRREHRKPFGGAQVLFIGDLLQLPPVVKEDEWKVLKTYYKSLYFFDALVLKDQPPLYIELDKIYRQADGEFISILNNLRNDQVTENDLKVLNQYYKPDFRSTPTDNYIYLTTHNRKAESMNRESLMQLKSKSYYFDAIVSGEFSEYSYPVESRLELKTGAQIMFIKNDPTGAQRFFNGKIGIVSFLSEEKIEVTFSDNSKPVSVEKYEWENVKYKLNAATNEIDTNVSGTFTQYPIKLAWAITVHKSQGLTFEKAIIDVGDAFAPGQVYVALSRLTTLKGLVLSSPINLKTITPDKSVTDFSNVKQATELLEGILKKESHEYLKQYAVKAFAFADLAKALRLHAESYSKDEQKSVKQKHHKWAANLSEEFVATKEFADKFQRQIVNIFDQKSEDYLKHVHDRLASAKGFFEPVLKKLSKIILSHLENVKGEKQVKTYLSELAELEQQVYEQLQRINKVIVLLSNFNVAGVEGTESLNADERIEEVNAAARLRQAQAADRIKEVSAVAVISRGKKEKKAKQKSKEKTTKQPKVDTKEASFILFQSGKSVSEIASLRSMVTTTIEGHLAHYVTLGELNALQFVKQEKLDKVISFLEEGEDNPALSPIKEKLGPDFSYAEIRFAVAYRNFKKKTRQKETA